METRFWFTVTVGLAFGFSGLVYGQESGPAKSATGGQGKISSGKVQYVRQNDVAWVDEGRIVGVAKNAPAFKLTAHNGAGHVYAALEPEVLENGDRPYELWLNPGTYVLRVEASGYEPLELYSVVVLRGNDMRLDLTFAAAVGGGGGDASGITVDNLLINGSMERWHTSGVRPQAWGLWTSPERYHQFNVFRETDDVRDGEFALRWESTCPVNVYSSVRVKPGTAYTLSADIKSDAAAEVLLKFSVQGTDVAADKRESMTRISQLPAGEWTRVALTGTMPDGAERATTYFCFGQPGTYRFDCAMLNVGSMPEYRVGRVYTPIAPLSREPGGETGFRPVSWDSQGKELTDQSVAFCFDDDILSYARLSNPTANLPKHVGAVFDDTVSFRGLSVLLDNPKLPENVTLSVEIRRGETWSAVAHTVQPIDSALLLQTGYLAADAVRINMILRDPTLPVVCPRIYDIRFMQ